MKLSVRDLTIISMFTGIICICSWISIEGPVPFTLQTFAIFASLLILKRKGIVAILIYILLGGIGLPVFAGFKSGISTLLGPTGGYIWGFLIIGIINIFICNMKKKTQCLFLVIGLLLCYLTGTLWFMHVTNNKFIHSLTLCVIPFIIPDLIKLLLAYLISNRVEGLV